MSSQPASDSPEDLTMPPMIFACNDLPSSDPTTDQDLPEGGTLAWCAVFGGFLAQFCGYGYTSAFGVYQAFYAQQYLQNESSSTVSWIGSLATFLVTGLGLLCGPLFDKGYFYQVYITGAVLQSLSIFTLSLVQPGKYYQILLAQGLTSGIGQGLMFIPSYAIVSHHFERQRAAVMPIVSSGVALGGVVNTIMLNKLLNGPIGFKTGVRISATFITALLFLSCILMRTRYHAVRQEAIPASFWKAARKSFTEIPSLLTIIGFMLFQIAYMYPLFYFQVDSLRHGLGTSFSFYSLVIVNAGNFLGRTSASIVLPLVGVIRLTIITTIVCAILIICTIWLSSVTSVVLLGLLYGFFGGMNVATMAPMLGLTAEPAELGVRMGVSFAMTGIGGLVGSPICGALLTGRYLWWAPAVFCGAVALAGAMLFVGVHLSFAHAARRARGGEDEQVIGTGIRTRSGSGSGSEKTVSCSQASNGARGSPFSSINGFADGPSTLDKV